MVWSELVLLGAGAVIGQGGSLVQRRSDRRDQRNLQTEDQSRTALQDIVICVQELSTAAEKRASNLTVLLDETIEVLHRRGLLIANADLRARVYLARDCLKWREVIGDSKLGAGIVYLTRYISGDLESAIGSYLRREPIPARSERMNDCEDVLRTEWATGRHC